MTKKSDNKYPENFETFVVDKLIEHDGMFDKIGKELEKRGKELERHSEILAGHGGQLLTLTEKVDRIDERTAFIPKMYQAMDAFMKEIRESRDDRTILGRRVTDHEERLEVVESALSIKPPSEVF
ncbi:MAG: hypothetical protein WC988_04150 [Patescibacteria group bacterium]